MKKLLVLGVPLLVCASFFFYRFATDENTTEKKYKSFLRFPLSSGLPRSLDKINAEQDGNSLYLIVHSPNEPIDYSSPRRLRDSILESQLGEFDFGHVQLAWSCTMDGKKYESATGFTGEDSNQGLELAKQGFGASSFLAIYTDGRFETPREVDSKIEQSKEERKLSIFRVSVSSSVCKQVLRKIWSKVNSKGKNFSIIGSKKRVAYCSKFISEILSPVPVINTLLAEDSTRSLKIPKNLFGNPVQYKLPKNVVLNETITSRAPASVSPLLDLPDSWPIQGYEEVRFIDPALFKVVLQRYNFSEVLTEK